MSTGGYVGTPTTYTPCEYIEGTGTQYINTGYKPNTNTVLKFKIRLTGSSPTVDYERVFEAGSGSTNQFNLERNNLNATWAYNVNGGGTTVTLNQETDYVIEATNQSIKVNGTQHNFTAVTYTSSYNLWLFRGNDRYGLFKLYYFQIYENDTLIHDFQPATYNGTPYLFDTVTKKYLGNIGTGTFSTGTEGTPINIDVARNVRGIYVGVPGSYTPIEYIQSSGTQYIDTGYKPNGNTKYSLTSSSVSSAGVMFGAYNSTWTDGSGYYSNAGNSPDWVHYYANTNTQYTMSGAYNLVIDKGKVTINNTQYLNQSTKSFSVTRNLYIFAGNTAGSLTQPTSYKLYSMKIYTNNVISRDFIPVLDSNNVACLYDKVTGGFFYNQGTGTFTAGNITGETVTGNKARKIVKGYVGVNGVARLVFNQPYKRLNYIESSGTQYINTGISGGSGNIGGYEIKFRVLGGDSSSWCQYFAGDKTQSTAKIYRSNSNVLCNWNGSGITAFSYSSTDDHTIIVKAPYAIVDGIVKSSAYAGYVWGSSTYYIFTAHGEQSLYGKMRLYHLKMWTNGNLVRDFIPVLDSNNVPCLYDNVSKTYFYNQGSGTFLYG